MTKPVSNQLGGKRFKVEIKDDSVVLTDLKASDEFKFPIAEIQIVGESTDQNGPYVEDWYLCLCDSFDWMEIPVESNGFSTCFEQLARLLGFSPKLELANSTDFRSRIIWPESLASSPLFEYKTKWFRFTTTQAYSQTVQDFLSAKDLASS